MEVREVYGGPTCSPVVFLEAKAAAPGPEVFGVEEFTLDGTVTFEAAQAHCIANKKDLCPPAWVCGHVKEAETPIAGEMWTPVFNSDGYLGREWMQVGA